MITGGGAVGVPGNWFETHAAVLPMFHIFALNNLLFHAPWCADSIVVIERFDPVQFPAAIERYKITIAIIVPPIVLALTRHPGEFIPTQLQSYELRLSLIFQLWTSLTSEAWELSYVARHRSVRHSLASLENECSSVAWMSPYRKVRPLKEQVDDDQNIHRTTGYGLTETSPTIAVLARDWTSKKYGSTGQLLPLLEARLIADNDEDAPEGGPGELWVRGPSIMKVRPFARAISAGQAALMG
jgi:4-coumarate--CoA ligase